MVLVEFIDDFEFVAASERGKTNARHVVYPKGMIIEVTPECAHQAVSGGYAEALEPDEDYSDAGED